jgi:hypothetical protein
MDRMEYENRTEMGHILRSGLDAMGYITITSDLDDEGYGWELVSGKNHYCLFSCGEDEDEFILFDKLEEDENEIEDLWREIKAVAPNCAKELVAFLIEDRDHTPAWFTKEELLDG